MTKKALTGILILAIALVGVLAWALLTMNEMNLTKAELSVTKTQLASVQKELTETRDELSNVVKELTDTERELVSTRNELADTEDELASTENELESVNRSLASTRTELTKAQSELAFTNDELESTEQKLTVAQETLAGLGITISASVDCYDAELIDNPESTNPTWAQIKTFLSEDHTDRNTYILHEYDCSEFSRDVHNNAEAAGIRAAVVHIGFTNSTVGHALNAFLTTDYGLVYVDCVGGPDAVARIKPIKTYRSVSLPYVSIENIRDDWWWDGQYMYYYIPADTGGQAETESIEIYW